MVNSSARTPGGTASTDRTARTAGASPAHRSSPAAASVRNAGPNIAWVDSTRPPHTCSGVRSATSVTW